MRYIIITPVYNEEQYLITYINSIIKQSIIPELLLIVDDNSSDNSLQIMKEYSLRYNWIKYVHHPSEQKKNQGSKVIEAFNYGFLKIKNDFKNIDFISKIDADLELPPNYFERVIETFNSNYNVGLCGGYICEFENNKWVKKKSDFYHIRGALKSYRLESLVEIGGLLPIFGWDGIDEMKLFMHNWKTNNIDISVKHFRAANSDYNPVKLSYRWGKQNFQNGCSVFFAFVRAIKKIIDRPFCLVSLAFITGYFYALISRLEKNVTKEEAKFINNFHLKRLIKRKFDI